MKHKNNRGFTLIELLAVITIIGIVSVLSIVAVSRLIEKSRKEQLSSQKKTIQMAAESYLQANRGFLPKSIGDTTTIYLSTLKNANYLKEDIRDSKGNSCMGEDSKVVVYKENATKYKYDVKLYCGNEKAPDEKEGQKPVIKVEFYYKDPATGKIEIIDSNNSDKLNKVADPRYKITISGCGDDAEDPTDDKCMIEGYNYSIAVGGKEVYSSGTVSANKEVKLIIAGDNNGAGANGSLKNYIDITKASNVVIYATARNAAGVVTENISSIDGSSQVDDTKTYEDKNKPKCGEITGQAGENEWINKDNRISGRTISIGCNDVGESGCVRSTYTKTWLTNKYQDEAIGTDTITIKDNAGNKEKCTVRVNIDVNSPVVNISAYRKGKSTDNILKNSSTINPSSKISSGKITINYNDYNELISNTWMNSSKFPEGVEYKISVGDAFMSGYTWEVNAPNQKSFNESNISTSNTDGKKDSITNCKDKDCVFTVGFKGEGFRYGKLTIKDKAGNNVVYNIYAKLDRTNPTNVKIENPYLDKWVNSSKVSYVLKLTASDSMSGLKKWRYKYASTNYVDYPNSGVSPFNTSAFTAERNENVYIGVCDNADNCYEGAKTKIQIDNTAPNFTTNNIKGYIKKNSNNVTSASGLSAYNSSWKNAYVFTEAKGATDSLSGVKIYKYSASGATSVAVTNGTKDRAYLNVNKEGSTTVNYIACDNAGNCTPNRSYAVKLDRSKPKCNVTGQSTSWTKNNRKITVNCTDNVSSCKNASLPLTYSSTTKTDSRVIEDQAGNKETCTYNVYVDKTTPNCGSVTGASTSWTNNNRTVVQACTDGHSGCAKASYSKTFSSTTKTYTETIADKVGNTRKCTYNVYVDKTAPSCTNISGASTSWTNSSRNISFTCKDDHSGCKTGSYSHNYTSTKKTDSISLEDKVGNKSTCNLNVYVDKTAPSCSSISGNSSSWTKSNRTVTVNCSDGHSGCENSSYSTTYSSTKKRDSKTIRDKAGNSTTCSYDVYVDKTAPQYWRYYQAETEPGYRGCWTVEFWDDESGIVSYQHCYKYQNGSWNCSQQSGYGPLTYPGSWLENLYCFSNGNRYAYMQPWEVCDAVGNCSNSSPEIKVWVP